MRLDLTKMRAWNSNIMPMWPSDKFIKTCLAFMAHCYFGLLIDHANLSYEYGECGYHPTTS